MLNEPGIHNHNDIQLTTATIGIAPQRSIPKRVNSAARPSNGKERPATRTHQQNAFLGWESTRRRPSAPTATKARSSMAWSQGFAASIGSATGRSALANSRATSTT